MTDKAEEAQKPKIAAVKSLTADRDKALVEKLEGFIEMAKDGHLSDLILIAKVRGEPITEFDWEGESGLEILGALELAKQEVAFDLLADAHGEDEGDEGE